MFETLKEWDRELFIYLNSLGIEQFDSFWLFVTKIESWIFLFIIFTFLLFKFYGFKKGGVVFLFVLLTFGITFLATHLTKVGVARFRPSNNPLLVDVIRVLQNPTDFSFFSGHASSSFSITLFVVLVLRKYSKWIYLAFVWPLLFVLSRIYVGVHYPSDLLVGALVGSVFAVTGYWLCTKVLRNL
ncbi:MAG: phosphatase PAP2 family protein [Flavobacteriaceae bacterium]|nr:phosphatase PAP2 family protein [Flavobacteriaceae bacterium]